MKCFYGDVHSHTTESDGKGGTPEQAYDFVRNVAGADYFCVTDHNTALNTDRFYSLMPKVAEEKNEDGAFAAMFGYEMSYTSATGYYGHANILNPKNLFFTDLDLNTWYDALAKSGETGIGQFNHPGDKWGNFNDYQFDPRMDEVFRLMELRISEYGIHTIEEEYDRALSLGWHISPASNEDAHNDLWAANREEIGAVLAEKLTREDILDAMRKNRTFATTDHSFRLFYRANGQWLGSRLAKTGNLHVEIECSTEKECGLGVLQLVGEHNVVLAQIDAKSKKSFRWELDLPDDQKYVYVKRISGMQYAISAPVWVEQEIPVSVQIKTAYQNGKLYAEAIVTNPTDSKITNVFVDWTLALGSVEKGSANAVRSRRFDMEKGETESVVCVLPIRACDLRLIASVHGECNGKAFADNRMVRLAPVTLTQLFPNTASYHAEGFIMQPFCCFDLQNRTDIDLDLSDYLFRIYSGNGRHQEFRVNRILPAGGLLTVWMKGKSGQTLETFNEYFGTALTEDDVYCVGDRFLPTNNTAKLTIAYGDVTLARAWVRADGYHHLKHMPPCGAFRYAFKEDNATLAVTEFCENAKPGKRLASQCTDVIRIGKRHRVNWKPVAQRKIGRVACITDGCEDPDALLKKAKSFFPDAEVALFAGDSVGSNTLIRYFFNHEKVLLDAQAFKPDLALFAMGANDAKKKRIEAFKLNFNSFSTAMINITRPFLVRGCRIGLMMPIEEGIDPEMKDCLIRAIRTTANTIGAELYGVPEETVLFQEEQKTGSRIKLRKDAVRIACIGDDYSDAQAGGIRPYAERLQRLLGDGYDVRIFIQTRAKAAISSSRFYLTCAVDELESMKAFRPELVISWFAGSDLKTKNAIRWNDGYREEFITGYRMILEMIRELGSKSLLISCNDRTDDGVRRDALQGENGMVSVIKGLAKEFDAGMIDIYTPTHEDQSLLTVDRRLHTNLTQRGIELLANLIIDWIGKNGINR